MPEKESKILDYWPTIKDDLRDFASDTDAWIISELKQAHEAQDWGKVVKLIAVMEMVHNMAHAH